MACKTKHKSGEQSSFCNYGPNSLLPSMSKVFEYAIFNQLMSSLTDNHLFCIEQLGFRSGQSTKYATLRLVDYLTNKMDDFNVPIHIFMLTSRKLLTV